MSFWALTRVLELPSHDRVPLVQLQGKVSVRVDPLGVVWRRWSAFEWQKEKHREADLQGYMTVSEVGRMAMCSSSSD